MKKRTTFKFRKGGSSIPLPNGSKSSIHNSQLLVSLGLKSFDKIVGGGLPVGSILMVEEDSFCHYCNSLLKYFLSEGLSSKQVVIPVCPNVGSEEEMFLFNYTHYLKTNEKEAEKMEKEEEEKRKKQKEDVDLKIAFRYNDFVSQQMERRSHMKKRMMMGKSTVGTVSCAEFDLSKKLQEELLKENEKNLVKLDLSKSNFDSLLDEIEKILIESTKNNVITRIGLQSIGTDQYCSSNEVQVMKFLYSLRSLVRNYLCVCLITFPKFVDYSEKIKCLSDTCVSFSSFNGDDIDIKGTDLLKKYQGFFQILRISKINSLSWNFKPDQLNYVFNMKKRKLYIEKLHLDPEGEGEDDEGVKNELF